MLLDSTAQAKHIRELPAQEKKYCILKNTFVSVKSFFLKYFNKANILASYIVVFQSHAKKKKKVAKLLCSFYRITSSKIILFKTEK